MVSISIPRYWALPDGSRSDFSQLMTILRSQHSWKGERDDEVGEKPTPPPLTSHWGSKGDESPIDGPTTIPGGTFWWRSGQLNKGQSNQPETGRSSRWSWARDMGESPDEWGLRNMRPWGWLRTLCPLYWSTHDQHNSLHLKPGEDNVPIQTRQVNHRMPPPPITFCTKKSLLQKPGLGYSTSSRVPFSSILPTSDWSALALTDHEL